MTEKQTPIPGDKDYSHAHYWCVPMLEKDQCGLAHGVGPCLWPKEPGLPWCNGHTHQYLQRAKQSGYATAEQIRWLADQQKLDATAADVLARRWERFHQTPQPDTTKQRFR